MPANCRVNPPAGGVSTVPGLSSRTELLSLSLKPPAAGYAGR